MPRSARKLIVKFSRASTTFRDAVVCTPNAMTFNTGCDRRTQTVTKLCLNQAGLLVGKRYKSLI